MTHLPKYKLSSISNGHEFRFISLGKARIKKRVAFSFLFKDGESEIFNLGFGDEREDGTIDDLVVTDNGDTRKVLATVVQAIFDFTDQHPEREVFFMGSTVSRSNLYSRIIEQFYEYLAADFDIFGVNLQMDDEGFITGMPREPFTFGRNYESFMVVRKSVTG